MMNAKYTTIVVAVAIAAAALLAPGARAGPYVPQGPFVTPAPGPLVPLPPNVSGKEYSDNLDKDATGTLDPEQVIAWDGAGGVADTFDYTGSRADGPQEGEVDALANFQDALFHSVIANTSALLFSVGADANIYGERIDGSSLTWATPPIIDQHGVSDVDGLEVWGEELVDDSNRYSLYGDPAPAGGGRTSVWAYNPAANVSTPYITAAQIAGAIGREDLENEIDLDAMMIFDGEGDDTFTGPNDWIMFSIAPLQPFDGGEIWVWNQPQPLAGFLSHGGHIWDTPFPVAATFGLNSENVNALEAVSAVPEPLSLIFFGTGIAGVAGFVARRKR